MKDQNTTTAANLTQYATIAASVAIRGHHKERGDKKLTAVQNDRHADTAAAMAVHEAAEIEAQAAKLKEDAKAINAAVSKSPDAIAREAASIGHPMTWIEADTYKQTQRAKAAAMMDEAAKLDKLAAAKLARIVGHTFGEFQPLAHDAIVGKLTAEQTAERLAYVLTADEVSRAAEKLAKDIEAHEAPAGLDLINAARSAAAIVESRGYVFDLAYAGIIYRATVKAVNDAIKAQTKHDSNRRTTEEKTLATPEMLEAWRAVHGDNCGKTYKVYQGRENANFYTMEYREYKTEPSGFYLVYHHVTIAPTVSLEAYTDNNHKGEADTAEATKDTAPEIVTNGGIPMVETQEARERLEAILENSNFTEREREFTRYFLSPKAAHAGQKAVNEAEAVKVKARRAEEAAKAAKHTAIVTKTAEAKEAAKEAEKAAKLARAEADKIQDLTEEGEALKGTELIRYRAMRKAAAAHVGIETDTAERKFVQRWRERAAAHVGIEQGCTTPEEAAEAEAKAWEKMQKNGRRGGKEAEVMQVLFVGIDSPEAIEKAAAQIAKAAKGKRATKADKARAEKAAEATKATPATWKPGEAATIHYKYTDTSGKTHAWSEAVGMSKDTRAAEAITPGIDYRAAEIQRRAAEAEAQAARSTAQNRRIAYRAATFKGRTSPAAFAAHDAQAAALIFWDAMTEAAQDAIIAAEDMTARERTEAAQRAARLAWVEAMAAEIEATDKPGKTYTAEEVEAMRARATARAAEHDHIMAEARARERARAKAR